MDLLPLLGLMYKKMLWKKINYGPKNRTFMEERGTDRLGEDANEASGHSGRAERIVCL